MITEQWIKEESARYKQLQIEMLYNSLDNEQKKILHMMIGNCYLNGFYLSSEGCNAEWGNEEQIHKMLTDSATSYISTIKQ